MGSTLLRLTENDNQLELAGALEHNDHDTIGTPVSEVADVDGSFDISDDVNDVLSESDVLIDFTHPSATEEFLQEAKQTDTAIVIGTTGLNEEQTKLLNNVSDQCPIVKAPNMSVGVNLLANLVAEATETLGEDFNAEVIEMHHRHKTDAPSGTARMLAETVADTRNLDLDKVKEIGREGFTGERTQEEIGIASLRGGDVVGDHTVILAGEGERVELTHKASSRETFARGALRSAKFIHDQQPDLYSMQDVLDL